MSKGITKKLLQLATKLGGIDNVKSFKAEQLAKDLLVNKVHKNFIHPKQKK
jgi:hypothetical protein